MGGQFAPTDPVRCPHYAQFASGLDRRHFDGVYWTLFILVIICLFVSSWVYQSIITYRAKPGSNEDVFREKLKWGLLWCSMLFLTAGVMLVIEVFCLLALQYCDGEDLMSLLWSTWTMLQLGSEIAILGIVLALWHHLYDIKQPLWALALGTPVLVVAGFGHVMHLALRVFYKRAKAKRQARKSPTSTAAPSVIMTTVTSSSTSSIKPAREEIETKPPAREIREPSPGALEAGQAMYFALDVGDDERVRRWPSFVGTADGKTIVQLTAYPGAFSDDELK
ncbi:hypothetical protein F4818DRAFT_355335 [Hypoxylon cercidicola]|nr:hypothetical protein F4818DRAFT_355335 [Hypoxylon cercidicola]